MWGVDFSISADPGMAETRPRGSKVAVHQDPPGLWMLPWTEISYFAIKKTNKKNFTFEDKENLKPMMTWRNQGLSF